MAEASVVAAPAPLGLLTVNVCFSPSPRSVHECRLQVPAGSTLAQAVALAEAHPEWPQDWPVSACQALTPGVWNRKAHWHTLLREGDRVELYRELRVDPKVARRERFGKQGRRRAGLFANKRPGAAAGY